VSKENTHPWLYRGWVFAHNRSINRGAIRELLRGEYRGLKGDTDSEAFFHLIVQESEHPGDPVEGIKSAVEKIVNNRIGVTSLNFVASDGKKLYALQYATKKLDYYSLYYLETPREK